MARDFFGNWTSLWDVLLCVNANGIMQLVLVVGKKDHWYYGECPVLRRFNDDGTLRPREHVYTGCQMYKLPLSDVPSEHLLTRKTMIDAKG